MRVAIYGAGAMGTILGAYIAASGKQIDLITRNKEHVEAMKQHGARVLGHADFTVRVNAYTPDEMSGIYDIIFLMTKQRENPKILVNIRDYLSPDGVIVTMQNGLPEPSVISAVGAKRCLGCAVAWGATTVGLGEVELTSKKEKMTFSLGSMNGITTWIEPVKEYLECAGKVIVEENFFSAFGYVGYDFRTGVKGQVFKENCARTFKRGVHRRGTVRCGDRAFAGSRSRKALQVQR